MQTLKTFLFSAEDLEQNPVGCEKIIKELVLMRKHGLKTLYNLLTMWCGIYKIPFKKSIFEVADNFNDSGFLLTTRSMLRNKGD